MNVLLLFLGASKVDDIPARDLTREEIIALERKFPEAGDIAQILVDTGCYTWASKHTGKRGKHGSRAEQG